MAQPPSTDVNETFLREVDENLRRDRARDFARQYGSWLIGGLLLFLAAAGGFIFWQSREKAADEAKVEEIAQVYRDIGSGNLDTTATKLDGIVASSDGAVRASAEFTRAALALEQKDQKGAIERFRAIASNGDYPAPYRDLALLRQTALEFDQLKPDDVIARLAPLAKPDSPWFGSASEMTAAALLKQGKTQEAGKLFASIASNRTVPDELRARAVQIAGTLGVDASAALDRPAQ